MCEFYFLNVDKIGGVNWNLTSEKHEENRHENPEYWTPIFICSNSGKLNLSTFWLRAVWIFVVQRFLFPLYYQISDAKVQWSARCVQKAYFSSNTVKDSVRGSFPIIYVIFMRLFKLFMFVDKFFCCWNPQP